MSTRIIGLINWGNIAWTVGTITISNDLLLKIAAFLFVSFPLGLIQWWNLMDRYRERRAKNAGSK